MYSLRHRSSSPLGSQYRSSSTSRSFHNSSYTSPSSYDRYNSVSSSLNPSIRRVKDLDLGISDRYSSVRSSPQSVNFLSDSFGSTNAKILKPSILNSDSLDSSSFSTRRIDRLDFSLRKPYTSSILPFSSFRSASRRVDYTDFIKPVIKPILRDRPVLRTNYTPRSRAEREKTSVPISRDRKLIKFREVSDDVIRNVKRKFSWAIPDDEGKSFSLNNQSFDFNELGHKEPVRSRESSFSRIRSRENSLARIHSPRTSITGGSSRESSLSRLRSPRESLVSCRSREHSLSRTDALRLPHTTSISTEGGPPAEFCERPSAVRSLKSSYTEPNKVTSQSNTRSRITVSQLSSGAPENIISGAVPSIEVHDFQIVRRRRRRDLPAELETEENENADYGSRSRQRRRRSSNLESAGSPKAFSCHTDVPEKNKIQLTETKERKIRENSDMSDKVKNNKSSCSQFYRGSNDNFEKPSLPAPATNRKIPVLDRKLSQQEDISVSFTLPAPKPPTSRQESNKKISGYEKCVTNADNTAPHAKPKSSFSAVSKSENTAKEDSTALGLKFGKQKGTCFESKKNGTSLTEGTLKFRKDKPPSDSHELPSIVKVANLENTENHIFAELDKNNVDTVSSCPGDKAAGPRKPSLQTFPNALPPAVGGTKSTAVNASTTLRVTPLVESDVNTNVTSICSKSTNDNDTNVNAMKQDLVYPGDSEKGIKMDINKDSERNKDYALEKAGRKAQNVSIQEDNKEYGKSTIPESTGKDRHPEVINLKTFGHILDVKNDVIVSKDSAKKIHDSKADDSKVIAKHSGLRKPDDPVDKISSRKIRDNKVDVTKVISGHSEYKKPVDDVQNISSRNVLDLDRKKDTNVKSPIANFAGYRKLNDTTQQAPSKQIEDNKKDIVSTIPVQTSCRIADDTVGKDSSRSIQDTKKDATSTMPNQVGYEKLGDAVGKNSTRKISDSKKDATSTIPSHTGYMKSNDTSQKDSVRKTENTKTDAISTIPDYAGYKKLGTVEKDTIRKIQDSRKDEKITITNHTEYEKSDVPVQKNSVRMIPDSQEDTTIPNNTEFNKFNCIAKKDSERNTEGNKKDATSSISKLTVYKKPDDTLQNSAAKIKDSKEGAVSTIPNYTGYSKPDDTVEKLKDNKEDATITIPNHIGNTTSHDTDQKNSAKAILENKKVSASAIPNCTGHAIHSVLIQNDSAENIPDNKKDKPSAIRECTNKDINREVTKPKILDATECKKHVDITEKHSAKKIPCLNSTSKAEEKFKKLTNIDKSVPENGSGETDSKNQLPQVIKSPVQKSRRMTTSTVSEQDIVIDAFVEVSEQSTGMAKENVIHEIPKGAKVSISEKDILPATRTFEEQKGRPDEAQKTENKLNGSTVLVMKAKEDTVETKGGKIGKTGISVSEGKTALQSAIPKLSADSKKVISFDERKAPVRKDNYFSNDVGKTPVAITQKEILTEELSKPNEDSLFSVAHTEARVVLKKRRAKSIVSSETTNTIQDDIGNLLKHLEDKAEDKVDLTLKNNDFKTAFAASKDEKCSPESEKPPSADDHMTSKETETIRNKNKTSVPVKEKLPLPHTFQVNINKNKCIDSEDIYTTQTVRIGGKGKNEKNVLPSMISTDTLQRDSQEHQKTSSEAEVFVSKCLTTNRKKVTPYSADANVEVSVSFDRRTEPENNKNSQSSMNDDLLKDYAVTEARNLSQTNRDNTNHDVKLSKGITAATADKDELENIKADSEQSSHTNISSEEKTKFTTGKAREISYATPKTEHKAAQKFGFADPQDISYNRLESKVSHVPEENASSSQNSAAPCKGNTLSEQIAQDAEFQPAVCAKETQNNTIINNFSKIADSSCVAGDISKLEEGNITEVLTKTTAEDVRGTTVFKYSVETSANSEALTTKVVSGSRVESSVIRSAETATQPKSDRIKVSKDESKPKAHIPSSLKNSDFSETERTFECEKKEAIVLLNSAGTTSVEPPTLRNQSPNQAEINIVKNDKNDCFIDVNTGPKTLGFLSEKKGNSNSAAMKEAPLILDRNVEAAETLSSGKLEENNSLSVILNKSILTEVGENGEYSSKDSTRDGLNRRTAHFTLETDKERATPVTTKTVLSLNVSSNAENLLFVENNKSQNVQVNASNERSLTPVLNGNDAVIVKEVSMCDLAKTSQKCVEQKQPQPALVCTSPNKSMLGTERELKVHGKAHENAVSKSAVQNADAIEQDSTLDHEKAVCDSANSHLLDSHITKSETDLSLAKKTQERSENKLDFNNSEIDVLSTVPSKSFQPDTAEVKKVMVCIQNAQTPKTENRSAHGNVSSRGISAVSEAGSSSEEEGTSSEEETSFEEEGSTSDDDNRLPGYANIVPGKKRRFIGLVTKAALNENIPTVTVPTQPNVDSTTNVCSVNCHLKCEKHMPNLCGVNQKLLAQVLETVKKGRGSENDERSSSRSPLSSVGCDNSYVSFSSPISSSDLPLPEGDSPRRNSSSGQQEKASKLRFKKYTLDDFQFLKLLGKGSFGKVLLAELRGQDMYFAVKCLKKDVVLEDDDVECTMIERRILALGTQHPYMCKLYCTFQTDSHLFFVMEYLNGGDLMFHIQESGRFDQDRARFYGAEITSALKFLHKKGIVYRDIKLDNIVMDEQGHIRLVDFGMCQCRVYREECMPFNFCGTPQYIAPEYFVREDKRAFGQSDIKVDNILLDMEGHARLADFGMCKIGMIGNRRTSTFCGTPDYIPPEIVTGKTYNQSVDWWSFGVLLYEMLTGRSPFNGTDEDELFWSICNEEPHYPRFLTKEARQLVELLLIKTPSERLGMPACSSGDITEQPFFSPINWSQLEKKQIQPPFKPSVRSAHDTSNFDSTFTMDSAKLSPVESEILQSMDQAQFRGFSYTNPHITG